MQTAANKATAPAVAVRQLQPATNPKEGLRSEPRLAGKLIRLLERASTEELGFLEELVEECNNGTYDIRESAFIVANRAMGFSFLNDPDNDKPHADDLEEAWSILSFPSVEGDRYQEAFESILRLHRTRGRLATLDDMLLSVTDAMSQEDCDIRAARNIINCRPDAVRKDIQKMVREHPEILQEVTAAK